MIKVVPIPPAMIAAGWPDLGPLIAKGLQVAEESLVDAVAQALNGKHTVWAIADAETLTLYAVCFTRITEWDGRPYVILYGLAGREPRLWSVALGDVMADYARAADCEAVRFAGKSAWAVLVPHAERVGEHNGVGIYERAAA